MVALQFAEASKARTKIIIYLGDGSALCHRDEADYLKATLKQVTERNGGKTWISTIGILNPAPANEQFLIDLAEKNGGTYTRIER